MTRNYATKNVNSDTYTVWEALEVSNRKILSYKMLENNNDKKHEQPSGDTQSPGWYTLWLSSSTFKCPLRYNYQLYALMRKTGHLQALSCRVAEPLSVSTLLASNLHSSPLWRTWGNWDSRFWSNRHSVLSSLQRLKCKQSRGFTLL